MVLDLATLVCVVFQLLLLIGGPVGAGVER